MDPPGARAEGHGAAATPLVLHGSEDGAARATASRLSPEIRDIFGQGLEDGPALGFEVGPADAALFAPGGDFVVLDPGGAGRFAGLLRQPRALRVEAWAVGPDDWAAWHAYRQDAGATRAPFPPGRRVLDTTVPTEGEADELVETRLDLSPALEDGLGQIILVVRPVKPKKDDRRQAVRTWVQATQIGLDAFADGHTLLAWATGLVDGRPLERRRGEARARRARPHRLDGTRAPGPRRNAGSPPGGAARRGPRDPSLEHLLVARAIRLVSGRERADSLRFYTFDDRQMYRPGEEVRVKGWVRHVGGGPEGDVGPCSGRVARDPTGPWPTPAATRWRRARPA